MGIKKIVFTPLSMKDPKKLYTCFGGIRFYDETGAQIDVIGNEIIKDELKYFESEKAIAKSSYTHTYGSYYYVGNAFRNDRPQTGKWSEYAYWAACYTDDCTLSIEFKKPLHAISKIEFSPAPDPYYNDRGVSEPFDIIIYDEQDNEIIRYNVIPKYDTPGYIQTLQTPELLPQTLTLFADKSQNVYYYDFNENNFKKLNKNKQNLTKSDFINYGTNKLYKIDFSKFLSISDEIEFLAIPEEENKYISGNLYITGVPKEQLIIQKQPIILKGYEKINQIKIDTNIENEGIIKVVVSRDLNNWYTYKSGKWNLIKSAPLSVDNYEDINLILQNGLDINTFNNLNWNIFKKLYEDEDKKIYLDNLHLAFVISKQDIQYEAEILNVTINATPKAFWENVTHRCKIMQGYSSIQITFYLSGDFKINYID